MDADMMIRVAHEAAKRTCRVRLRLREQEMATLVAAAAARGVYLTEYVREASLAAARAVEKPGSG